MKLSANESRMVNQLALKGSQRSDQLASALGVSPSIIGNVGIGLRSAGLVASTNDGKAYQLWSLTEEAKRLMAEARVVHETPAAKPFRVLQVCDNGITLFDKKYMLQSDAQNFANTNIDKQAPDVVNYVVTLHSAVKFVPPVAAGRDVVQY
jgi:hypothetical protein